MSSDLYAPIGKTLKAAGLRKHEACQLFGGMTRQCLYNWEHGKTPRVRLQYDNALRVCAIIDKAVELGYLPLPKETPTKDRRRTILLALKKARVG